MNKLARAASLYRMIWRWHFYAGLFVVPMILILSLTGAAYLFKPQVERWEERAWQGLETENAVTPEQQYRAVLSAYPGAKFHSYRVPNSPGDATMIHVGLPGSGRQMLDVFVSPQGRVVGSLVPDERIMEVVKDIHGQLLMGKRGSLLVELAASWAIVMVLTGLYLWWPRGRGISGVLWPRLSQGGRTAWRDMHAVTGFWVSGLALVLLLTGLPWAEVWGSSFKAVRAEMGWVKGAQDWTIGGETPVSPDHAEHDHAAMMGTSPAMPEVNDSQIVTEATASLSQMVMLAKQENLAFPVLITPPGAPGRFGKKGADGWTIRSDSQDRTLRTTITYDAKTGQELTRETFADDHVIDRVVGYGVSWHEGQLFGWINQLIGVISALMLITLSITGFVMWRRRKPQGQLGAPPLATSPTKLKGVAALVFVLAAFLPLLAASLLAIWLVEFLIIRRMANVARWLGMPSDKPHSEDI